MKYILMYLFMSALTTFVFGSGEMEAIPALLVSGFVAVLLLLDERLPEPPKGTP